MGQSEYFAESLLTAGGDTQLHLSFLWAVGCCGRIVQLLLQCLHPRDQLWNTEVTKSNKHTANFYSLMQSNLRHRLYNISIIYARKELHLHISSSFFFFWLNYPFNLKTAFHIIYDLQ